MSKQFIYCGTLPFSYYLVDAWGDAYEVSEDEFYSVVGRDRDIIPMSYDSNNINRQNFYCDGLLFGYRER